MRGGMTWRASAAVDIRAVLEATRGRPEKEIRAALRKAYPWGERKYWPYKVWCDEIRRQRGLKTSPARRAAMKAGQASLQLFDSEATP